MFSTVIVFFRLYFADHGYFTKVLWAEDGLFTLCNVKASSFSCLFDGNAGYFAGLPRFMALIVSRFPMQEWATVMNFLILLLIFVFSAITFHFIYHNRRDFYLAFLVTIAPSIINIAGIETIGVMTNFYLTMTFYLILILTFDNKTKQENNKQRYILSGLIFIHAISTPLGVIPFTIILISYLQGRRNSKSYLVLLFTSGIGNFIQAIYVLMTFSHRNANFEPGGIFSKLLGDLWKSIYLIGDRELTYKVPIPTLGQIAVLLIVLVLLVFKVKKREMQKQNFSLFRKEIVVPFFSLLSFLAISIATNGSPWRYLFLSTLLVIGVIAGLADYFGNRNRRITRIILLLLIVANGVNTFAASAYRVSPPSWKSELLTLKQTCEDELVTEARVKFSPNWPPNNQDSYQLYEPTTDRISCVRIRELLNR
ncbi:unannotated protein [freshwater metagenome]|uniref:Unannotated protein n=1 Tax=freshwater metagenome TaxID=449393 RepID=A0A6J6ZJY2_9ZZZZ